MQCSASATTETSYILIDLLYFDDDEGLKVPLGNKNISTLLKFKCKYFLVLLRMFSN